MKMVFYIAASELRRIFISPFAWTILATVQFTLAIFFYLLLSRYLESGAVYAGRGLTEIVVVGVLQIAGLLLLLISPFVTMRSFSEDLRSGTIKLLLSSPVSVTALVLGKYLGLMGYFLCLVFITSLFPASLVAGTSLDPGLVASGLLALILLLCAFAAAGLFVSALSLSPTLAATGTFVLLFFLWIIHIANDTGSIMVENIANYLSLQKHFNALLSGAFSSVDVIYFLLLSTFFVMLCIWRVDAIRTHR